MTTKTPNYLKHFPDFDLTPLMYNWAGSSKWKDTSYRNDECPSFASTNIIQGFVVKAFTPYKKDLATGGKFILSLLTVDDEYILTLLATSQREKAASLIIQLETAQNTIRKL